MSAFLQHLNVTARFEGHATVLVFQRSRSHDGVMSNASKEVCLRNGHCSFIQEKVHEYYQN
jgi:hypothetical protein